MFGNYSKSYDYFYIDSSIGFILLVRILDYEQFQQYKIFVRVVDSGMFLLSSDVIVIVDVIDFNDNLSLFD